MTSVVRFVRRALAFVLCGGVAVGSAAAPLSSTRETTAPVTAPLPWAAASTASTTTSVVAPTRPAATRAPQSPAAAVTVPSPLKSNANTSMLELQSVAARRSQAVVLTTDVMGGINAGAAAAAAASSVGRDGSAAAPCRVRCRAPAAQQRTP